MLNRPSRRRRNAALGKEPMDINLVPVIDCLVTLIVFLLFTTAFLAIVTINSPVPILTSADEIDNNKVPLNLTVRIFDDRMMLEGGFGNIVNKTIMNLETGEYDLNQLHEELISIKEKHLKEKKIILMPEKDISYDTIVKVMDSAREIFESDPPLYTKDKEGNDIPLKMLFPTVVFGNILSS